MPVAMKPAIGKSNNWYTPALFMAAVQEVLGTIDLDVASCEFANQIVKAIRYYTIEDNALLLPWPGRVFCNPPYGRTATKESLLRLFVGRLLQQYQAGICTEAILLIPVNTATRWFVPLWQFPICFPKRRIRFYNESGKSDGASFPTCFVYLGQNEEKFIEVFSKFGPIARGIACSEACEQLELFA
jgi:DNA N-6-adenine-methyltransferase (Dam)